MLTHTRPFPSFIAWRYCKHLVKQTYCYDFSASLELKSLFLVDADVVESGLKVTGHLHSSTGSDLTVKVLDGYGVDVKLGLPVKNQEIINFYSDVVTVVREKHSDDVELPIKFNVKR